MKQNPNIIWFHLDGIRPNRDFGDHKDKPYYLDKLAEEGVEYTNVYTSYASTVMSISSVITGYPCLFYTKCLENVDVNTRQFRPLTHILKENSYETHSILFYRPARKVLKKIMFPIKTKYYGRGVKDSNYMWNSKEVNKTIINFLNKKKLNKPYFLYLQYCFTPIKGDDSLNDVHKMLNYLKKNNYFENTIIIIWADHGWPSPQKEKQRTRLQKTLEGHDLNLTEESVKVPLIFIYPGCKKGLKITKPISTLSIGTELLKLLGIKSKFGIKHNKKFFRIDTRNYFQKNRRTALTDGKYKYIISDKEEFYDVNDETKNLINSSKLQKQVNKFRKEYQKQEKELFEFQTNYLADKVTKLGDKDIQILKSDNSLFNQILYNGFKKITKNVKLVKKPKSGLLIIPITNPFKVKNHKNALYIDYNFNLSKKPRIYPYMWEKIKNNWKTFITEPKRFMRWLLVLYLRAYEKLI